MAKTSVAAASLMAILILGVSSLANAEEAEKRASVYVKHSCSQDVVGQRLTFKVKEALNRSTGMISVDRYLDSLLQLNLVCLPKEAADPGYITHYSYSVTWINLRAPYDFALTSGVGSCGTNRLGECAEDLVVLLNDSLTDVRESARKGEFKWP